MNRLIQTLTAYAFMLMLLTGCAALYRNLEPPTLQLISIATPGMGADMTVQLTARVRITNPNDVSLPVRGGELRLVLNGDEIASAVISDEFTIAAGESSIVELPAALDLRSALGVGLTAWRDGTTQLDYRLAGHIDLGVRYLGRIPVAESGSIELGGG